MIAHVIVPKPQKQYLRLLNTFELKSIFYLLNFLRRNLKTKMWWTFVLLVVIELSKADVQVACLKYSTVIINYDF